MIAHHRIGFHKDTIEPIAADVDDDRAKHIQ